MLPILAGFSAFSFYIYGFSCVFTTRMVAEFERYGLARLRALTGYLQIAGATGLLLGLGGFPRLGFLAAVGLSLQMFSGLVVRVRIRDRLVQCLPAFVFMVLNAIIAYLFIMS